MTTSRGRPAVIAHRGASGLAYENSPSAFRLAKQRGADGVELDIHATSDGGLAVHHDPEVAGLGPIAQHTLAEVSHTLLPNGEAIPLLSEVLQWIEGLDVWVEVKSLPPRFDSRLLEAIDRGPTPDRYAVHGFDHRIVARLGQARPTLPRGCLLSSYLIDPVGALSAAGATTLWQQSELLDQDLVTLLHEREFRVIAWTADSDQEIGRLAELGVDGICTNFPDRALAVLARSPR